ncbi:MAG: Crp/Fnr family transcriptional regulator [Mangrovibacterium sp.]
MIDTLINHIEKYLPLEPHEVLALEKYTTCKLYRKREYLLRSGETCRFLHFVSKGCLRMYYINEKSNEQITQFALEGWWITDFNNFTGNKPSDYFIQAIENAVIISFDAVAFDKLLNEIPRMERYFRLIWQRNMAASQSRARNLYQMSKEEFFYSFADSFPGFMQRVPQYMVASYLGLTPEYVSELRKKRQL